jgi:hypothetical protein
VKARRVLFDLVSEDEDEAEVAPTRTKDQIGEIEAIRAERLSVSLAVEDDVPA